MKRKWVLIEDDIKVLTVLGQLVEQRDSSDEILVLPFKMSKEEFLEEYSQRFTMGLPAEVEVGTEIQRFDDLVRTIAEFGEDNLLVLLDIRLETGETTIQNQEMLEGESCGPHRFWSGLLKRPSNVIVLTSTSASAEMVQRKLGMERVDRCGIVTDHRDTEGARLLVECAKTCWKKRNQRLHGDDLAIDALLSLYAQCWQEDWDEWKQQTELKKKAFAHDWFNMKDAMHSRKLKEWLGVQEVDSKSMKGLFMAKWREEAKPERGCNVRGIRANYLRAALAKLDIPATLQQGVEDWRLPICPGISFLVSLKEFLNALSHDHGVNEPSRPPRSIDFRQWQRSDVIAPRAVQGLHIRLETNTDDLLGLARAVSTPKHDGKLNEALQNLVVANAGGVPVGHGWSTLFRVDIKQPAEHLVAVRCGSGCVELFWCPDSRE